MASERDANAARAAHDTALGAMGAHALAVDRIEHEGKQTFGVIAYVSSPPAKPMPPHLTFKRGSKTVRVPLKVVMQDQFRAE